MPKVFFRSAMVCFSLLAGLDVMASRTAGAVEIAATVAPVHSLVAMVTAGVSEPDLIVRPGASPHDYALKPSEAMALDRADLVFSVGGGLEPWMAKAVTTLAGDAVVIELGSLDEVTRLEFREGGVFGEDDHGEDHDDEHDHGHNHGQGYDPHLWLDPDNARIWLDAIAKALIKIDPGNTARYQANAEAAAADLRTLTAEIDEMLEPARGKPYVVFHDAYHYFERRFRLEPLGAVSFGDADRPGPARIVQIRDAISESGAVCIFAEPQFAPKLIETVTEGSDVKAGMLDPIGAGSQPGPDLYPALLRGLAVSLSDCLG